MELGEQMKIKPSRDITRNRFKSMLTGGVPTEDKSVGGQQIFRPEDMHKTKNILSKLLRKIFIDKQISKKYLELKYREYAINVLDEPPSTISTGKGNLLSAITREDVTFKKFYEVLHHILGFELDIQIGVEEKGETITYSVTEHAKKETQW